LPGDPRARVLQAYEQRYRGQPEFVVRAPGRVNLIGEHTDYNEGYVLPMAIGQAVWIALRPTTTGRVEVASTDFEGALEFEALQPSRGGPPWGRYLQGVAWALAEAGYRLHGWRGVVGGDIPIGAGLSSSAALEMAAASAFAAASGFAWDPVAMAKAGQRAENEWVGVRCGIMDQMVSAAAKAGHALLIDCRTLELRNLPLPPGVRIVVIDSGTRRGLVESAYNERRRQCEEAARRLGRKALRDVSGEELARSADVLPEAMMRRARHVVGEIERTLQAAEALARGDAAELGALMTASHVSLRHDFEVSTRELDLLAGLAGADPACYGARMTGAGFGGCIVAAVKEEEAPEFAETICAAYLRESGLEPRAYAVESSSGAQAMRL
jgi:galactokinase